MNDKPVPRVSDWRLASVFALALVILVSANVGTYRLTTGFIALSHERHHAQEILEHTQLLLAQVVDAETGQRGYLITGNPAYLEPYNAALPRVNAALAQLVDLTKNDPEQRLQMEQFQQLIATKLGELRATIDLRRQRGPEAAQRMVATNLGKGTMDAMRGLASAMVSRTEGIVNQRYEAGQIEAHRATRAILGGNILSYALLLAVFVLLIREIRERRRAEEPFRLMIENVKDYAIFMLDADGRVATWNAGAQRFKGYLAEEIVGKHFSVFYTPDDVKKGRPQEGLKTAAAEGRFEAEGWRVRKDGSRFYASVVLTALRNKSGELRGFCKVTRDITARKQAEEELLASNKELDAFSYSVAHDLRAPLRHIDAFSRILEEEKAEQLDAEGRRYLGLIRNDARQAGKLIDDLLSLARLGRQELACQDTDLNEVIEAVVGELKAEYGNRHIEWRISSLPRVECDAGLLKQVFTNLLSNAVKYSRPRDQAVIEVGETRRDNQRLIFVCDNGVGFDMKHASKIFEVFQRLHGSDEFEGTGVGLATVQRIVQKHGGRIWAESQLGRGATFLFNLKGL